MSNAQTVQEIYEAFGRGDIAAILDRLAEDVAWDVWEPSSPVQELAPLLQPRRGRADVADFFASLGDVEFKEFTPLNLLEDGDQVVAIIRVDIVVASTGGRIEDMAVHVWNFDADGVVTGLRHVVDTYKHVQAFAG